ncbi:putative transcriptional regulator [Streptomyces albus]|uniref:Putative transcriptional regulator n=1 Tax=Streptomyces albus (strain ATCC 21838 / DSM 41398 / FERM P-419 / JCM 4703 / NBRC 107858) TaxID=1081613 RepID=A0A0B5ENR5_STRA4|nr:putative transcriptional regulator [Streptomyces albus]AOU74776.1 putative transcriptional regulator [Streptomyces albus]AYN30587.1 AraC family transcriptional regulator [Streptomyces albus]
MADIDVLRSAASAEVLLDFAVGQGLGAEVCLSGTGIDPPSLRERDAQVLTWQELRMVRNVRAALTGRPLLGVAMGGCYHLSACGVAGLGLLSAPDIRTGLGFAIGHRRLFHCFCRVLPEPAAIRLDGDRVPHDVRHLLVERDAALMLNALVDSGVPSTVVRRVEFSRDEPREALPYVEALGVPVVFGRDADRLLFEEGALERPLRQANPRTFGECLRNCRRLVERSRARDGVAGHLRTMLAARPEAMPSLVQAAAEMVTTPRTLRRRLAEEGTTYRALKSQVRIDLAADLLLHSGMTIEEIGAHLGYSETAAFSRAFKARTGSTPYAFRSDALRSPSPRTADTAPDSQDTPWCGTSCRCGTVERPGRACDHAAL